MEEQKLEMKMSCDEWPTNLLLVVHTARLMIYEMEFDVMRGIWGESICASQKAPVVMEMIMFSTRLITSFCYNFALTISSISNSLVQRMNVSNKLGTRYFWLAS